MNAARRGRLCSSPASSSTSCSSPCSSRLRPSSSTFVPFVLPLLLLFIFISPICAEENANKNGNNNNNNNGDDLPHQLWLIDPSARHLEKSTPPSQRLPETMCPTPKSVNDTTTTVLSGTPFGVRWQDPDAIPVEAAKFELFSADSAHLLAKLDASGGQTDIGNKTASVNVRIPDGLRCEKCVLRLSVELDERIQLLSCADVRVIPATDDGTTTANANANGGKECATDGQCGGETRARCDKGLCFCRKGFHGKKCAKESAEFASFSLANATLAQSVRFPITGSELLWKSDSQANILEFGLKLNIGEQQQQNGGQQWFIVGIQSTEEDQMCQLAMAQWKQKSISLEGDDVQLSDQKLDDGDTKTSEAAILNIRRLANGSAELEETLTNSTAIKKCGLNEHFDNCPETGRECEPSCDWTAFPDTIPSCAPRGEQCGQPRCVCDEGFVRLSNLRDECKPFSFCQPPEVDAAVAVPIPPPAGRSTSAADVVPSTVGSCALNETWEKCGKACEPSCDTMYSEEPCGEACGMPGCTCGGNFVRLASSGGACIAWTDCPNLKEIVTPTRFGVVGSPNASSSSTLTHGQLSSSIDSQPFASSPSANISSPMSANDNDGAEGDELASELFSGAESAAAAVEPAEVGQCDANETVNECGRVCETDCVSIFEREECHGCAAPACSCKQGFARNNGKCVYWGNCPAVNAAVAVAASSDQQPKRLNNVDPAVFAPQRKTLNSPKTGTANGQSSETPDENALDLCGGEWAWPIGCVGDKCMYRLRWNYDEQMSSVVFMLDTRPATAKKVPKGAPIWSGVGFSPSGTLLDADMAVLEVSGNGAKVRAIDMHVDEELEQLRADQQQDISGGGHFSNGMLRAKFWRKLRTDDSAGEDLEFSDDNNCFRFLFPVAGGRFEKSENVTVPVADSLYASDAEVCMRKCHLNAGGKKTTEQKLIATEEKENDQNNETSEDTNCNGEFFWPEGCEGSQCEYKALWAVNEQGDDVQFNISARGIGRWTGIGFSRDGRMSGSDIVTGWMYNQKAFLIDRFAHNQQVPAIDPVDRQDIFDIGGSVEDDVQTISFRRKIVSADRTTDLSLDKCLYYLFPVAGGRVLARTSQDFQNPRTPIGFHDQETPQRSAKKICPCAKRARGEHKTIGRAKRAVATENDAKTATGGGPYQCADVAIIQILGMGEAVRVTDAFALSNDSLFRDERWGGRQSFVDVSVEKGTSAGEVNIWLRKMMKDGDNAKGDLSLHKGITPVFLASGSGPIPEMNTAERLEFAMVDLVAGTLSDSDQSISSSSISTSLSTSTTTAAKGTTATEIATFATGTGKTATTATTTTTTGGTEDEHAGQVPTNSAEDNANDGDLAIDQIVHPAVVVTHNEDDVDEPSIMEIPELVGSPTTTVPKLPAPTSVSFTTPTTKVQMLPPAMLMDENCFGGFAHPENCLGTSLCSYMVEWQVIPSEQLVYFRLSAKMKPGTWTGIGFSSDGSMVNSDAILVLLLTDGRISVSDQFSADYGRPSIDRQQNAVIMGQYGATDGIVAVNFSRPLYTGDTSQDADLRQCQSFLFLHSGGPLVQGSAEIRKHTVTPIRSRNKICLAKCGQQTPLEGISVPAAEKQPSTVPDPTTKSRTLTTVETTTESKMMPPVTTVPTLSPPTTAIPAPPPPPPPKSVKAKTEEEGQTVRIAGTNIGTDNDGDETAATTAKGAEEAAPFNVALRLTNERWDERLEDAESAQFRDLAQRVANSLRSIVAAKWPSLRDVKVQKFAEGSVLALIQMHFDGHDAPSEAQLKDFLQEAAARGMAEELIWDRDMLDVRREGQADAADKSGTLRELQGWALVSVALLLLLCTISALIFCAFRSHRKRRSAAHRTYPTKQSPYSGGYHHQHTPQYAALGINGCDKASDTTIKTNATSRAGNGLENGTNTKSNGQNGASRTEIPKGIGEATYREWFSKVASKNSASHYQEGSLNLATPPTPMARHSVPQSPIQSYVSYPNDPSFYTLNGEHRIVPPPPAYYHQRPY